MEKDKITEKYVKRKETKFKNWTTSRDNSRINKEIIKMQKQHTEIEKEPKKNKKGSINQKEDFKMSTHHDRGECREMQKYMKTLQNKI